MLADEIVADTFLPIAVRGTGVIQKKIQAAQKFCLAPDFTLAADGLVENVPELERIAPFCRIPYPLCWFEFAHFDRIHWRDAPTHFPVEQRTPSRIGFLVEGMNKELTKWRTYLCWSLKNFRESPNNISELVVIIDITKAGKELWLAVDYEPAGIARLSTLGISAQYMANLLASDWAGEIRFIFAVLGLLNARNVAETEKVEFTKLNKKRAAQKKFSLSSHILLKIRTTHKRSLLGMRLGAGPAEMRAHFVRGHFKTRRTGLFWWGPHMRGKLEHGYVSKDYEVTE
jgi:hypothetical protein